MCSSDLRKKIADGAAASERKKKRRGRRTRGWVTPTRQRTRERKQIPYIGNVEPNIIGQHECGCSDKASQVHRRNKLIRVN